MFKIKDFDPKASWIRRKILTTRPKAFKNLKALQKNYLNFRIYTYSMYVSFKQKYSIIFLHTRTLVQHF